MTDSIRACLNYGINFFDTAELYGFGKAEELMGNSFKELGTKREEIVVTTKLFWMPDGKNMSLPPHFEYYAGHGCNTVGLSRKKIIESTKAALKRLQMDYVDVIFAHRPDFETPLEETCKAFSWVVDQGMAFYWGTSEWDPDTIIEAIHICRRLGLHEPVVEQCQYNLLSRERFEKEYRTLFEKYGYGSTTWSPLAMGFLSGRYNDGKIPEDSRLNKWDDFWSTRLTYMHGTMKDNIVKIGNGLAEISKELGCTQAQLALAWVIASKDVSTLLLGFSKLE